jgi:hypothetical protein
MVDFIEAFAFPLRTIEDDIPAAGEIIGFSVDIAAETNKNIAKALQQSTPIIFGFLPIPEASTVGLIMGYMVSTFFIFFNMALFVSRKHLGEAFTQSFALIPFVGMTIQNVLESGDRVLETFSKKRGKFIGQIKSAIPPLGEFLDRFTFDPNADFDPKEAAASLHSNIGQYTSNIQSSVADLRSKLPSKEQFLENAKQALPTVENLTQQANQLKKTARQAVNNYDSDPVAPAAGGKRLSRRKHKKSKWGTMKKSKR